MKWIISSLFLLIAFTSIAQQSVLVETISEDWIGDTAWLHNQRVTYEYNWNLNVTLQEYYGWDSTLGVWNLNGKYENTYNSDALLEEALVSNWSPQQSQWFDYARRLYYYNGSNQLDSIVEQRFYSGVWRNMTKEEYTYNGNGNVAENARFVWNMSNMWNPILNRVYAYNGAGVVTEILRQSWSNSSLMWFDNSRISYTLDANNQQVLELTEQWSQLNSMWENSGQVYNTFDADGNLIVAITQGWDVLADDWQNSRKVESSYNTDNTIHQVVFYDWEVSDSLWYNDFRITYYYDTYQGEEEVEDKQLTIYPNPATDFITLNLGDNSQPSNTQVLDSRGRLLVSQVGMGNMVNVNVQHLSAGVYFINVKQGNELYTGRFVKN